MSHRKREAQFIVVISKFEGEQSMRTIQVFDPALCCTTGVCGVDVDQNLVVFSADVDWAKKNGAQIERFNLAQQPMVFA